LALQELGQWDASLRSYERAIAIEPRFAAAHARRGNVLRQMRRSEAALESYDRAIVLNADYAEAYFNRANLRKELARWAGALADYDAAIAIKTDYVEARVNRSLLLQELGRYDDALASIDQALAIRPRDVTAQLLRGNLLSQLKQPEAALQCFDRALAIREDHAAAQTGRGNVLRQLNRFSEALACHDRALAADPKFVLAHVNRGNVLNDLARHAEAVASYDAAIAVREDLAEAHFSKALALLQLGDFARGWREYEWRWQSRATAALLAEPRQFREPLWLGQSPLQGRTILLHGEQGLGDRIQFCRYAALLKDLGARVLLEVPKALAGLFTRLTGVDELFIAGGPIPPFDVHCPLMSLPLALATRVETVPAAVPYLFCDPNVAARWRSRLGPRTRARVGLAWSGNPDNANDRNRSIPLSRLIGHLPDGFDYYSLHREVRHSDSQVLRNTPSIRDLGEEQSDFSDAAALCDCMDVIISVDTSLAHLGGALGKPTWLLLAFNADWRWLVARADSPWYPTMRLYRQAQFGEWDAVLGRVKEDLIRLCGIPT
jgi:tetratricopeptide (TPR) repeat protein